MPWVVRDAVRDINRMVGRRWQALDPLLPDPAALPAGCGAPLVVNGDNGRLAGIGMCWWTHIPIPVRRPLSPLTTSGAPHPVGSAAGSGSSGSIACQRRPTIRLMSRTASRTTHGMSHLPEAAARRASG